MKFKEIVVDNLLSRSKSRLPVPKPFTLLLKSSTIVEYNEQKTSIVQWPFNTYRVAGSVSTSTNNSFIAFEKHRVKVSS